MDNGHMNDSRWSETYFLENQNSVAALLLFLERSGLPVGNPILGHDILGHFLYILGHFGGNKQH